jgi:hypothetical protein
MSIEAGYEVDAPFEEPEHPDRQILDRFFDELGEGKVSGAAEELRALHAAGGSFCGTDVKLVAGLLDGSAVGFLFEFQLKFVKRVRGRPSRSLQSQMQPPWDAFATGDKIESSRALRKLNAVAGADVKILADLLDDDPALPALFPWRLVLKLPRRGRPRRIWPTSVRQATIARMVAEARPHKQMKSVVWEVSKQTGLSRAAIYKAAQRDKSRIK